MNTQKLKQMYHWMYLCREFDKKAVWLQRTGRLGTFPSSLHQEAIFTAAAMSLHTLDLYIPYYRDHAALLCRGVTILELLKYWGGLESGSNFSNSHDFPVCVPIATQFPHAVGASLAFKLQNKDHVVLCTSGDGATSKGDFYESLNFAKIHNLKIIFLINNNQWAISVPLKEQSATLSLTKKADAFDMPSVQIDGNDPSALLHGLTLAREKALDGPILVETLSYRICDHTTADDASRYQPQDERNSALQNDPLKCLANLLVSEDIEMIHQNIDHLISEEVDKFLQLTPPDSSEIFKHQYSHDNSYTLPITE